MVPSTTIAVQPSDLLEKRLPGARQQKLLRRRSHPSRMRAGQVSRVDVSVVIPVHNEQKNIPLLLTRLNTALENEGLSYEFIVIDDHSSDHSYAVAEEFAQIMPVKP